MARRLAESTEENPMRKFISAIAALSFVAAFSTANAAASKQETIGVGTGAIVGAAAGGPIGLVLGAAIGAKIGDRMYQDEVTIDALSTSLDQSQARVSSLELDVSELDASIDVLNAELVRMQRMTRPEVVNLLQAGIAMDLLFRTDEHTLADTTGIRLNELATTLATMPDIQLQLDGFADERGDEAYNHELSEKRVNFVREQLIAAGIEDSRITVAAHGESPAQDATTDSYALERRVSLTLYIEGGASAAVSQN
jgi:outer membrane protein OmpA-like peptidoglycan-associated protein